MTEFPKEISAEDFSDFKMLFVDFVEVIKDEYKIFRDGIRKENKAITDSITSIKE
jgi:hypothetical protein